MSKRRMRNYRSCYSCDHAKIYRSEVGKKMVECGLNGRIVQLKMNMMYPSWCGERKEA